MSSGPVNSWPLDDEECPTADTVPSALESFHDEVLAKLEQRRRGGAGSSSQAPTAYWDDRFEREADDEEDRLRRTVRALEKAN